MKGFLENGIHTPDLSRLKKICSLLVLCDSWSAGVGCFLWSSASHVQLPMPTWANMVRISNWPLSLPHWEMAGIRLWGRSLQLEGVKWHPIFWNFVVYLRCHSGEVGRRQKDNSLGKNHFSGKILLSVEDTKPTRDLVERGKYYQNYWYGLDPNLIKCPLRESSFLRIPSQTLQRWRKKIGKAQPSHIPVISEFGGKREVVDGVIEVKGRPGHDWNVGKKVQTIVSII